jgi:flavin reductase (DIM6/NTAB) family NADH-FMN oxidoreductase RutF
MKVSLGPKPLAIPMPAFLVATYDPNGQPNVMTAAWGGVLCSEPPLIGVSIRPHRWTHEGLIVHQAFTINIPKSSQVKQADYFGIVSGKSTNKLAKTSMKAFTSEFVDAPFINDCPVIIECQVTKTVNLGSHILFIGEIKDIKANENTLIEGKIDLGKVDPLIFGPNSEYFQIGSFVAKAFSVGKSLK